VLSLIARNINEAYSLGMMHFRQRAKHNELITAHTRGQRRWQYPMPVVTTYQCPRERVLFDSTRDANPFFHLMESLWILGGRSDVAWLAQWLPSIANYSDDGIDFHGAYGYRLRLDGQFTNVVNRLQKDPDTTRAVLAIYDRAMDSDYEGKDMPCNCTLFLGIQNGKLNLTVANRSNDMIWGAYGANVVQFSMLHEYIAGILGVGVGWYAQMSNNAHIYPDAEVTSRVLASPPGYTDPYDTDNDEYVQPYPLGVTPENYVNWQAELTTFLSDYWDKVTFSFSFFNDVAIPMRRAHQHYRNKNYPLALNHCAYIMASDWRMACVQWLLRRKAKAEAAA